MKLKPSKCEFFKRRIAFLGHIVSDKGIETDPKKIEAIVDWPIPKTIHDVCSFLGFTNYYRKFIYNYAQKAKPLNILISGENAKKKHSKVDWTDDGQAAFDLLKETCTNPTVLAYTSLFGMLILNTVPLSDPKVSIDSAYFCWFWDACEIFIWDRSLW